MTREGFERLASEGRARDDVQLVRPLLELAP